MANDKFPHEDIKILNLNIPYIIAVKLNIANDSLGQKGRTGFSLIY